MKICFPSRVVITILFAIGCSRSPQTQPPAPLPAPDLGPIPDNLTEAREISRDDDAKEALELGLNKLAQSPEAPVRRQALLMLAEMFRRENRFDDSLRYYRLVESELPEIAPFLRLHMIELQAALGDFSGAAATAKGIIDSFPKTSAAQTARIDLPALLALANDRVAAATALDALSMVAIDELTESEFLETAQDLERAGADDLAARLRFRMLNQYPQGRFIEPIYTSLRALPAEQSPLESLDFAGLLDLADRLGRANRYDQALDLLARVETRFPAKAQSPPLRYLRVKSRFNSRNYDLVIQEISDPKEPYHLATEILRARAFWRTDRNDEFMKLMRLLLKTYPDSRESSEMKLLLGKYYMVDHVDYEKAVRYVEEAISAGNIGNQGENLWTLGWIHTLAGNDAKALKVFSGYLETYPDADYTTNALFWAAKIHGRKGEMAQRDTVLRKLIGLYPYSYYGYRARHLLGEATAPSSEVASGYRFPALDDPAYVADSRVGIVDTLVELGMVQEAASELKLVVSENPADQRLAFRLADLYARAGEPLKAIGILQRKFRDLVRHGGSEIPPRFWEILFPRLYWEDVAAAAQQAGIDPYLVTSIIRQESGFEPSVVSNAGAVGLMQLMPVEVPRIAAAAGLPSPQREELFDPAKNVRLGAAEFSQKLLAMKDNRILAIAAYNAGEEAVARWIANTSPGDVDLFIDSIPFNETRLYVKSVVRNHSEYLRIYGHGYTVGDAATRAVPSKTN